jgi:hypothetical protein
MKNWLKNYRWHIISWATFILYEYLLVSLVLKINSPVINYGIHYIIIITFFYAHAELVLKWALKTQKAAYFSMIILSVLEICLYTLASYLADRSLSKVLTLSIGKMTVADWKQISLTIWRGIYFLLFSTANWKKKPLKKC